MTAHLPPLPASVAFREGPLEHLVIEAPDSRAELNLQGAQVVAWQPRAGRPVLFASRLADQEAGQPVRAGVPVCFPWLGHGRNKDRHPSHGLVRTRPWQVHEVREEASATVVVLGLDAPAGLEGWPHPVELTMEVQVGRTLTMTLRVRNAGEEPIEFEEALHTYLAVEDLQGTVVDGLQGARYVDTFAGTELRRDTEALHLQGATDRVYQGHGGAVTVTDGDRRIRISTSGARSTIVWNPGPQNAPFMRDFGDEEWRTMLCVESGNVWDDAVELLPEQVHTMVVELAVDGG